MNDRIATLRAGIDGSMRGVEYGPSYSPLFPKCEGWNVIIVDHASAEDLVSKYAHWGVPTERIEAVDVVLSDDAPIELQLAHEVGQIDYIVASHVFEHLPDPISFLQANHQLLKPGGILRLAIPDKRFCFDLLKPMTSAGQMIQAHLEKRTKHTIGQIFDALAMHALRTGQGEFPGVSGTTDLSLIHKPVDVFATARSAFHGPAYFDIHAWAFTPASFSAIMRMLMASGHLPFTVESIVSDGMYEFFVTLRKPLDEELASLPGSVLPESIRDDLVSALQEERQVRFPGP